MSAAVIQTVRLGEVLAQSDRAVASSDLPEVNLAGVYSFARGLFKRGPMRPAETSYKTYNRLVCNDFVISQPKAWEGALARVTEEFEGWFLSPVFPTFTADPRRLLPSYLEWYCKRKTVWQDLQILSKGMGARRETVSPEQFLSLNIPLPPIDEQRRIVARIEELAAKVEEARALRTAISERARALFASLVTHAVGEDANWQQVQSSVSSARGSVRSGPFGSQLLHDEFVEEGVSAIGTRDVQTDRFVLRSGWKVSTKKFESLRRYQIFPGDILCTIVGASIGRFCVVPTPAPLAFTTKHIQALTLNRDVALPEFVSCMLNFHQRCRDSLFAKVEGSAQPSLNAQKILATALPLPPLQEQAHIIAQLSNIKLRLEDTYKLQAETAAELDAMLPAILDKAFKGDL